MPPNTRTRNDPDWSASAGPSDGTFVIWMFLMAGSLPLGLLAQWVFKIHFAAVTVAVFFLVMVILGALSILREGKQLRLLIRAMEQLGFERRERFDAQVAEAYQWAVLQPLRGTVLRRKHTLSYSKKRSFRWGLGFVVFEGRLGDAGVFIICGRDVTGIAAYFFTRGETPRLPLIRITQKCVNRGSFFKRNWDEVTVEDLPEPSEDDKAFFNYYFVYASCGRIAFDAVNARTRRLLASRDHWNVEVQGEGMIVWLSQSIAAEYCELFLKTVSTIRGSMLSGPSQLSGAVKKLPAGDNLCSMCGEGNHPRNAHCRQCGEAMPFNGNPD